MKQLILSKSKLSGNIEIVPSKSLSHRYLMIASLANGISDISNVLVSKDLEATTNILRVLGINIEVNNNDYIVKGNTFSNSYKVLDAYESGSTLRFFIPYVWSLDGEYTITGSNTLGNRSLSVYEKIAKEFNYKLDKTNNNFPITTNGPLKAGNYILDGSISSQFVSGLLMVLPKLDNDSRIIFNNKPSSTGYIDLTIDSLNKAGVIITKEESGYYIKGNQEYKPFKIKVEGDYSQAAFFIIGSIITNSNNTISNLNKDSIQGDKGILEIIKMFGYNYKFNNNLLSIYKDDSLPKISKVIDLYLIPDLGPILMTLASLYEGSTTFLNVDRLYDKESNRLEAMQVNLEKIGVKFNLNNNVLEVIGVDSIKENVSFETFNDHRIAMALSILGLTSNYLVTINDYEVVSKSYPNFYEDLIQIGGNVKYVK